MNNSLKIILILTAFIIISTIIFIFLIIAYGASVGNIPNPTSDPEIFFAYFTNSMGISIGLVGTSLAIILAFNALRATEIQTTTVALQEFRSEIDGFINIANEAFDQFFALMLAGAYWGKAAGSLSLEYQYREHLECSANAEEAVADFNARRKEFITRTRTLHELLSSNGNIFIRLMVQSNLKKERSLLDCLIKECVDSASFHSQEMGSIDKLGSDLAVLSCLQNLAYYPALSSLSNEEELGEETVRDMITSSIITFLEDGEQRGLNDFEIITDHLATYLPVVPEFKDFEHVPITSDEFGCDVSEYDQLVRNFPAFDNLGQVLDKNKNPRLIYKKMLRLYASLINPESGLEAMRNHFRTFGAKEDVLRLFIETHSARLAYNYRREAQLLRSRK